MAIKHPNARMHLGSSCWCTRVTCWTRFARVSRALTRHTSPRSILRVTRTHNRNTRECSSAIYYNTSPRMHRTQGIAGWQISVISPARTAVFCNSRPRFSSIPHAFQIYRPDTWLFWLTCCKYIPIIPHPSCLTFYIKMDMNRGEIDSTRFEQFSNGETW